MATPPPKFGVWRLRACDRFGRRVLGNTSSQPYSHVFPLRRNPKLRQVGSTPKHNRLATKVLSAGACDRQDLPVPKNINFRATRTNLRP